VDFVLNFFNIFGPAGSTAAAVVALLRRRAHVPRSGRRHHGGPMSPGVAGLRIILGVA